MYHTLTIIAAFSSAVNHKLGTIGKLEYNNHILFFTGVLRMTRKALTDKQEKEVSKMYLSGLSSGKISRKLNVSKDVIKNSLKRTKTPMRKYTSAFKYSLDETSFNTINKELPAYWLGFIYADGCIHKKVLSISLSSVDGDHLQMLLNFLKANHPVHYRNHTGFNITNERAIITIHNNFLASRLKQLGILPNREKFYLLQNQLSRDVINHFIRGYLDGDGCIRGNYNPSVTFVGQQDILEWIRLQFHINVSTNPNLKISQSKGIKSINYCGINQSTRILNWLYKDSTIYLSRKKEIFDNWPKPKNKSRIRY